MNGYLEDVNVGLIVKLLSTWQRFSTREQRFSVSGCFEYLRRFFIKVENKDLVFVKVLSACEFFLAENKDLVLICEGFQYLRFFKQRTKI